MNDVQCRELLAACESAEIKSYEFGNDIGARLKHDGVTCLAIPDYNNGQVISFRNAAAYGGSTRYFNRNIEMVASDFGDIHSFRCGGTYEEMKAFAEAIKLDLDPEQLKVLIQIDKSNLEIIPETGDYVNRFKYLSSKEYNALSDEDKAKYDKEKAEYEEKKSNYLGSNQAARISL